MGRIKGPHWTLLAGLALAAVLLALDVRATPGKTSAAGYVGAAPSASPGSPTGTAAGTVPAVAPPTSPSTTGAPPTVAPPPSPSTAADPDVVDYAGRVDGGGASLAISVYHGRAIAYVCGGSFEVWFTGPATGGKLTLTSRYGATLTAASDGARAHGQVTGAGRHWTFTAPTVKSPSGLYRAYAKDRKVQATWVVLPDGSQIGAEDTGGDTATAAPVGALDLSTLTATLPDGQPVTAARLDGAAGAS